MQKEWLFALFFMLMVMQAVGVRLQVRAYRQAVSRLRRRGYVGIGGGRRRLGPGTIVLLACSGDGTIIGAETMQGMTIFSRFRERPDLYGRTIYDFKNELSTYPAKKRKKYKSYEQAADALIGRLQKEAAAWQEENSQLEKV